jgi:hypothetical protein
MNAMLACLWLHGHIALGSTDNLASNLWNQAWTDRHLTKLVRQVCCWPALHSVWRCGIGRSGGAWRGLE